MARIYSGGFRGGILPSAACAPKLKLNSGADMSIDEAKTKIVDYIHLYIHILLYIFKIFFFFVYIGFYIVYYYFFFFDGDGETDILQGDNNFQDGYEEKSNILEILLLFIGDTMGAGSVGVGVGVVCRCRRCCRCRCR